MINIKKETAKKSIEDLKTLRDQVLECEKFLEQHKDNAECLMALCLKVDEGSSIDYPWVGPIRTDILTELISKFKTIVITVLRVEEEQFHEIP